MKAVTIGCLVAMALGLTAGLGLRPQPAQADRPQGPQVIVEKVAPPQAVADHVRPAA